MNITLDIRVPNWELFVVLLSFLSCIYGQRYAGPNYYSQDYFEGQQRIERMSTAINKLDHSPNWVSDWPNPSIETSGIKIGQVSGVAMDNEGRVLVFHRANHKWDEKTFSRNNVYLDLPKPPIPYPTVLVFNDTGELVEQWGENLFHIPHGITVDTEGNVFVTDVALHQVLKFNAGEWKTPAMTLGTKFVPGSDENHFCKPSAVAVLPNGDFFIADGYCNHRILKLSSDGTIILQWGTSHHDSPFGFSVPHALTVALDRGAVCVADREHGRVGCFRADNGTFLASYSSWLIGPRLFSVAYAPVDGGRLYVVNGPSQEMCPVRGYVIDYTTGRLLATFAPDSGLSNPHDVVVSPDGSQVYVAELNPTRVYKFYSASLHNATRAPATAAPRAQPKPTATIELSSPAPSRWEWWWGAAGGAGGAGGAGLLALAALALLRARNKGRKSVGRRRWEYGQGEFKLRRLLERRRFTRVHSDDSDEEPAPMLPHPPANA